MSNGTMRNYQVNFVTMNVKEKDKKHNLNINFGGETKGLYPDFSAISLGDATLGKDGKLRDGNGFLISQAVLDYAKVVQNNKERNNARNKQEDDLIH